jgi:hypothetical protein
MLPVEVQFGQVGICTPVRVEGLQVVAQAAKFLFLVSKQHACLIGLQGGIARTQQLLNGRDFRTPTSAFGSFLAGVRFCKNVWA